MDRLTMEEFNLLCERQEEIEQRWNLRFGTFCATYINSKLKEGTDPYQPGDFFGIPRDDEEADGPEHELTAEESVAKMQAQISKAQSAARKRAGA